MGPDGGRAEEELAGDLGVRDPAGEVLSSSNKGSNGTAERTSYQRGRSACAEPERAVKRVPSLSKLEGEGGSERAPCGP